MDTYLDRIKSRKAELKLTNEQLAERSGIPLGTLSKILAGMSDSPKLATMISQKSRGCDEAIRQTLHHLMKDNLRYVN